MSLPGSKIRDVDDIINDNKDIRNAPPGISTFMEANCLNKLLPLTYDQEKAEPVYALIVLNKHILISREHYTLK